MDESRSHNVGMFLRYINSQTAPWPVFRIMCRQSDKSMVHDFFCQGGVREISTFTDMASTVFTT